jgi:hypothetical protein
MLSTVNGKVIMNGPLTPFSDFYTFKVSLCKAVASAMLAATGIILVSLDGGSLPMTALSASSAMAASSDTRASHAVLANGMEIVVIPDHRAPVVTHMVWYKVGAADEPSG